MAAGGEGELELRHQLGSELRRLREQAGLSGRTLAGQVGISQSKLSRIESGSALPTLPEISKWASATSASPETSVALRLLADAAYTGVTPFGDALRAGHLQAQIGELEAASRLILGYQPSVVPGLLQTAAYTQRVLTLFRPDRPKHEIAADALERGNRQAVLFDPEHQFKFLIAEAALRYLPGPGAAAIIPAQIDRIASVSTLENVEIGLIPLDAEALTYAPSGFQVFERADAESHARVRLELVHAIVEPRLDHEVQQYRDQWTTLSKSALPAAGAAGRQLLEKISDEMRKLARRKSEK
jgi:transcriptional regulator with XRE-family HTH domain